MNYSSSAPFRRYETVHEAMKTCSNIMELRLHAPSYGCEDLVQWYSLPFPLDGSDRYTSAPRVLSLKDYHFDHFRWQETVPPKPHWSDEDGSWPASSSSNPVIVWGTEWFYCIRFSFDKVLHRFTNNWSFWWEFNVANDWYKWRHLPVEQRSKENLQLWLEAMDFSQIHTLSISQSSGANIKPKGDALFRRLPATLTNLRSLTIEGRWVDWRSELEMWEAEPGPLPKPRLESPRPPRARDFILALPPRSLRNFTWTESAVCDSTFEQVMRHHGASLRQLEWTNSEVGISLRPTLSMDQLRHLGEWAPELEDLTIDLNRENKDWPFEQLKVLAKGLPSLKRLTINFDLLPRLLQSTTVGGVSRGDSSTAPRLDADAVKGMFRFLQKFQRGGKLETLNLREANWKDSLLGYRPFDELWTKYAELEDDWRDCARAWAECSISGPGGSLESELQCRDEQTKEYKDYMALEMGEVS